MSTQNTQFVASSTIVEQFLEFFRKRQHKEIAGSPLVVPGNSTSFVIAGMQPLLPYLRGSEVVPAPRMTSLQRCLRSNDIDEVGKNARRNTAFHMLGSWSIGDYHKTEAISMALELLVDGFGLDMQKLWVTVFAGEPEYCLLRDHVATDAWLRGGIAPEHIVSLGVDDNLWTMGSNQGPCGPCTEVFVDRGIELGCGSNDCRPGCECDRFLEVWNLVFMEYEFLNNGAIVSLPVRNIDTGLGLERFASVVQGAESVYTIDLFKPAQSRLDDLITCEGELGSKGERLARRIIVDHTRAVLLALCSGARPGRDGRDSVVRRLIRRAARQGRVLGIERPFLSELVQPLAQGHGQLLADKERAQLSEIEKMIAEEERLFSRVLTSGLRYLEQIEPDGQNVVSGEHLFRLHAERGFPADLASEVLTERGVVIDWNGYTRATEEHRQVSRVSVEKRFRTV